MVQMTGFVCSPTMDLLALEGLYFVHRGVHRRHARRPGHGHRRRARRLSLRELRGYLLTSETFANFQLVVAGVLFVLFFPSGLMGWVYSRFPRLQKVLP